MILHTIENCINIFNYFSNGNSCENEVDEDLEDGEIFDEEDDIEMADSTEQNTEPKVSKENRLGEGAKEKNFEPLWEMVNNKAIRNTIIFF